MIHIDDVLARLDGVRGGGNQWSARCPCRADDNSPSLAVGIRDDKIVFHCFRGGGACTAEQICEVIKVEMKDLFPDEGQTPPPSMRKYAAIAQNEGSKHPNLTESRLTEVATYDYEDAAGRLLFQKIRYVDEDGRKTFRQRRPDGSGGWVYSLGDTPKVLYNLPAVAAAVTAGKSIYVVEGEKDADELISRGFVATTMSGGAGQWLDIHTETLAGAIVDVIVDNDDAGKTHSINVFHALQAAGCDVAVWISPEKKDISDHLAAGLTMEALIPFPVDVSEPALVTPIAPVAIVPLETDFFTRALGKITDVMSREDLTEQQKLVKMQIISSATAMSEPLDAGRLVSWWDFVHESERDEYDWIIPGLLERGERVIIVAAEGVGKTMLMRQIAICAGAGVHPFTFQPIRPVRTLTVDLENPEMIIRRMSKSIVKDAAKMKYSGENLAKLWTKPAGLDLLKAADRLLLEEQIEKTQPELICLGPLYKAYVDPGGRTSDAVAIEIVRYLDYLRVVYKTAMWFEHHAPLGTSSSTREMRPFGSSIWSRWPEFGISLTPAAVGAPFTYEVKHFRGARDIRKWPTLIRRAANGERFVFTVLEYLET